MTPDQGSATTEGQHRDRLRDAKIDFEELLRVVGPKVRSTILAKSRIFTETDVDDILAEALAKAWRGRAGFDEGKGPVEGWFFTIAMNTAADFATKKLDLREVPIGHELGARTAQDVEDGRESSVKNDIIDILTNELTKEDRELILGYANGIDLDGGHPNKTPYTRLLSESLSISPGAIRTRCHRVIEKIKQALRERGHQV
jgi:RNA polymerase sigma factor (sigma-70 family)